MAMACAGRARGQSVQPGEENPADALGSARRGEAWHPEELREMVGESGISLLQLLNSPESTPMAQELWASAERKGMVGDVAEALGSPAQGRIRKAG